MRHAGYASSDICDLFALHGVTTCPSTASLAVSSATLGDLQMPEVDGSEIEVAETVARFVEAGDEGAAASATIASLGVETLNLTGLGRVEVSSSLGVRMRNGVFDAIDVDGERYTGTWTSNQNGSVAALAFDTGGRKSLLDRIRVVGAEVGLGDAALELVGDPALRLDFKAKQGVVKVRLVALVKADLGGRAHLGVYEVREDGITVDRSMSASP
jgi:hypothetical protein